MKLEEKWRDNGKERDISGMHLRFDGFNVMVWNRGEIIMVNLFMVLLLLAIVAGPVFFVLGIVKKNKAHFKKAGIAGAIAVVSFIGVGMFGDSGDSTDVAEDAETKELVEEVDASKEEKKEDIVEEIEEVEENTEYGLDEWWEVENQWKLKIDSVSFTDERNQFSDKDPEAVIVIEYTYENLGYESDVQDLFITPDNVIDGEGKVTERYPAGSHTSAKPTPIGATTEGAQESYGVTSEEGEIAVHFDKYDDNSDKQKVVFIIPLPSE